MAPAKLSTVSFCRHSAMYVGAVAVDGIERAQGRPSHGEGGGGRSASRSTALLQAR
jgi:hypothetical protein